MKTKFVKETYGAEGEPTVIRLNRKQVTQMCEIAEHFKEVDNFELHITGDTVQLRFVFGLDQKNDAT